MSSGLYISQSFFPCKTCLCLIDDTSLAEFLWASLCSCKTGNTKQGLAFPVRGQFPFPPLLLLEQGTDLCVYKMQFMADLQSRFSPLLRLRGWCVWQPFELASSPRGHVGYVRVRGSFHVLQSLRAPRKQRCVQSEPICGTRHQEADSRENPTGCFQGWFWRAEISREVGRHLFVVWEIIAWLEVGSKAIFWSRSQEQSSMASGKADFLQNMRVALGTQGGKVLSAVLPLHGLREPSGPQRSFTGSSTKPPKAIPQSSLIPVEGLWAPWQLGDGRTRGWAPMNLVDGWQIHFPGETWAMPRGREGWWCVTTWCSCSWGPAGALWPCVLLPPSSGCPQACNMSPPLPQVPFSSAGRTLTLLLRFLGCYLPWDCALLQLGFLTHSLVLNYSCTKFWGAGGRESKSDSSHASVTGLCLLFPSRFLTHDLALRNVSLQGAHHLC